MERRKPDLEIIMRYLQWWDPIGAIDLLVASGGLLDEYDSYAREIHNILESNAGLNKLIETLEDIESNRMGRKADKERIQILAEGLIKCYKEYEDLFY